MTAAITRTTESVCVREIERASLSVLTCPSNLSALPETSGLPSNTQASFRRYLVATLSVQSAIISYLTMSEDIDTTLNVYNETHCFMMSIAFSLVNRKLWVWQITEEFKLYKKVHQFKY